MLVGSMSYKEFFDAFVVDAPKVKYKLDSLTPKAIKKLCKKQVFPAWEIFDYTIPSTNNTHYFFFYSDGESVISTSFFVLFHKNNRYVFRCIKMGYQHTPESDIVMLPIICIYTSHFFQRYNERFLHNDKLTANEVAGIFFARNEKMLTINLNEEINRNYKNYGEQNYQGIRVSDGFCFADSSIDGEYDKNGDRRKDVVDAMRIIYTTFVSKSELTESQKNAINEESKKVLESCAKVLFR